MKRGLKVNSDNPPREKINLKAVLIYPKTAFFFMLVHDYYNLATDITIYDFAAIKNNY